MYRIALFMGCLPRLLSSDPSPAFCSAKVSSYVSAFIGIEAWRKNEAVDSFGVLKKGELITVEGYFKPEEWTDSKSGEKRDRVIMVATKFYPTPEKEEEKPDQPKKAASKKKKGN